MSQGQSVSGVSIPLAAPGADNPAFMHALEQLEAEVASTKHAKADRKRARSTEEQQQGVSRAALNMRIRRQRPDVQAQEKKALAARDKARRILADRHPEEYLAHVQECRKALGLPPIQPRGHSGRETDQPAPTPQHPAQEQTQQKCRHGDYPLRKLPYGKFCGNCGQRL